MKIQPLAQGSAAPSHEGQPTARSADSSKIARAKAIASGEATRESYVPEQQVQRAENSLKKIKMRTQASVYRDGMPPEQIMGSEDLNTPPEVIEPAPVAEEIKPLSPQFAALAKAKRALQIERAQFDQEKASLTKSSAIDPNEFISKADLLANPLKLFELGVTQDQFTEALLNNTPGQSLDPQKLRAELKEELKKELMGEFSSRDQQAEQQVMADIKKEALNITSDGDDFEAIRTANAQQYVVDLVYRTWKETGEILDTREAAELVENQLIDEAMPYAQLKKVQSRLTPAQEAQLAAQIPAQPKAGTKIMRTLTNRDTAQSSMDRRARAIAAANGTLKRG